MGGASRLLALHLARPLASSLSVARRPFQSRPLLGLPFRPQNLVHTQSAPNFIPNSINSPPSRSLGATPWPEWVKFVDFVVSSGFSSKFGPAVGAGDEDFFAGGEEAREEFTRAVEACVGFARDRPELLRSLSKEDVRIVVENCSPSLFKNGGNSTRRLRAFLDGNGASHQAFGNEMAGTIDIMRYLLSYVWHSWSTQEESYSLSREIVEKASRKLFSELMNANSPSESWSNKSFSRQTTLNHEPYLRPPGQNIEMKKGDWICPKCSFMNFARNTRCLECNDVRPKRVLAGGEWECPQCEFFNYGRNMSCIRCDCRRPLESGQGVTGLNGSSTFSKNLTAEQILSGNSIDNSEIERKLAANDEKAERWFSKMSQLGDTADLSSAAADEDFPEIMPMRKGVNRFVVSTRKTPLERRLSNNQNNINQSPSNGSSLSSESISKSLDRIFGRTSATSGSNSPAASGDRNTELGTGIGTSEYMQRIANKSREPGRDPFVPLSSNTFSNSQNGNNKQSLKQEVYASIKDGNVGDPGLNKCDSPTDSKNDEASLDTYERWSDKVVEQENMTGLPHAKSDDDFPDIVPMRKGENHFIISKKKDRSFTAPQYKERIAMEQVNNSNFVPFVPLPSDYFAKKDKKPENSSAAVSALEGATSDRSEKFGVLKTNDNNLSVAADSTTQFDFQTTSKLNFETSGTKKSVFETSEANFLRKEINEPKRQVSHGGISENYSGMSYGPWNNQNQTGNNVQSLNTDINFETSYTNSRSKGTNVPKCHVPFGGTSVNYSGLPLGPWNNQKQTWNNSLQPQHSAYKASSAARPESADGPPSSTESWNSNFPVKSLEGSAVSKEPDPLDMSQEAKTQRWFRRVAQIKDISELANIPDEDFPDIMPMRKGVNRFVVSKRKTPLERRLTSPQYRKNLPIISSEPDKDSS